MSKFFVFCVVGMCIRHREAEEQELRHKIYQAKYMPADMLLPPYILIPRILQDPKYRSFGVSVQENIATTDAGSDVVSHAYETQFQTFEDLEKLRPTRLVADQQAEKAAMDEAVHVFEGIAPVHWQGVSLHSGLWDEISQWQGVEECSLNLHMKTFILILWAYIATSKRFPWASSLAERG